MKLKKFKERNKKEIGVFVFPILCILLISGVIFYRTFAIFEVKTKQNVIKGTVQDPGNLYFAFYVDDKIQKDLPSKDDNYVFNSQKSYCGVIGEKDDSIKLWWDRDDWSVIVSGMQTSRTKCNLYFEKRETLIDKIKNLTTVESGNGLYIVKHEDVSDINEGFKENEYRYAGKNPNNYIKFNNEVWRIIGLVNVLTSENVVEQRVKIVRNQSIGNFSWDSSDSSINNGNGVSDWRDADLNILLNDFYYNSKDNRMCFNGANNNQAECDFKNIGLKNVHDMIDNITWNLGTFQSNWNSYVASKWYEIERSNNVPSGNSFTWHGEIALYYASDYLYSTSGGDTYSRTQCLSLSPYYWNTQQDCYQNNWMYPFSESNAFPISSKNRYFYIASSGLVQHRDCSDNVHVFPTLYLTENVHFIDGIGSSDSPYIIG